jgi:hypothetical protein
MPGDVVRAIVIAIVVGSTLVLINHGDHLADEPVCRHFCLKVTLSYLTPLMVSLVTARLARRAKEYRR